MPRHRTSVFAVAPADWMKYRPYLRFLPGYDDFYLRLANDIFEELNTPQRFFRSKLERGQIAELAVVLASWFEDYANEIGLWSTFVRKNKDLHGYWLPFYNLEDYDTEDMNPEDISYLVWHFCCKAAKTFIAPDSPGLSEIAEPILELFDEALEKAPGTDFYDEYLNVSDDIYFFDVKAKLHWLAFQNYLTGPEFVREIGEAIKELSEEKADLIAQYGGPGKIIYAIQDDFLYKKSSSFLAFTIPEWLAEVAHCPDHLRPDIRRLFERVIGEFVYEGNDKDCYLLRHLYTKRLFHVRQESVTLQGIPPGDLVFTTIVNWRGEWWVTGTLAGIGNAAPAKADLRKNFNPSTVSFYAWSEEQKQSLRETVRDMEAAHLDFFGERMVFFKNENDMNAAFEGVNNYYNSKIKAKGSFFAKAPKPSEHAFSMSPQELKQGRGVAIFFEPGEGTFISPFLAHLAWLLTLPEISDEEEASSLFFDLFRECSPAAIHYMLERFSTRNLRFPVNTDVPLLPHLEFLMRFYDPGAFREIVPNNSFMPEG